ncbi:c-type cytochrome [Marivita hallyeonensis]|uniref:Cytochrome C oxidase, cbb3-type, subunit III n=1 Tax=Marivita hallyeonensis TaxID=996342 RepID=A0A1M5RBX7_9RHOB|nr:cytochrome c [Marivita hallyeonensis]SHH23549.1 Cytochrome C oxidase, cbb3-type, subunit III [Marivita hallyeonensis]
MKQKVLHTVLATALCAGSVVMAQDADIGQRTYEQYCATCHGMDGSGGGPLTEIMTASVPDLTGLAAAHEGQFPMLDVIHIIDGRTGLRAHGGPMPVYGALFDEESHSGTEYGDVLYTRGKVLSIAYYLESIQK